MFISFKPFKKCRLQRQRNKVNLSPCAQLSDLVHHMLIRHALAFIAFREKGHEAKSPASEVIRFLICVFFFPSGSSVSDGVRSKQRNKGPLDLGGKKSFSPEKEAASGSPMTQLLSGATRQSEAWMSSLQGRLAP